MSIMADELLLEFIRLNQERLGWLELHAAMRAAFPAKKLPSLWTLQRFLAAEREDGRKVMDARSRGRVPGRRVPRPPPAARQVVQAPARLSRTRIDRDAELQAFLIQRAKSGNTIDAIRTDCLAQFPADRVPSRSVLHRWMKAKREGHRRGHSSDEEVAAWIGANMGRMTIDALHAGLADAFSGRRVPSRTAIARMISEERAAVRRRQHAFDLQPLLPELVALLAGKVDLEPMLAGCHAMFPEVPLSRLTLARAVEAELRRR